MKTISKGYWQCILMVCLVFVSCMPEIIELPSRVKSVTTNEPARITVNSATLCANVNLVDSNTINCGIIYDISSKLSSSIGTKKNTIANGDYSVNLSGLKPNTTYYYRAYAVDLDMYKYGEICSFKTDISVTTTKATDITYNSAILGGSVVSGGQTLTCGVIYGTSSTLSSSNGTMKTTESSGSYSITVSELNPNTTYYYCAYAVVDGEYKYGEVCTFNTLMEVTVTTGTATDITENSVILSATINNSEKSLACGIIYGTSSSLSSSSGTKKSTTSLGTFSVSLTGLSSNTTYYYRAYVIVDGEYKYGEVSSFKTSKEVTVSTGSATNVTDNGATLSGTINNSGKSLTCGIIYGTISDVGTKEYTTSSGAFSVSLTGLRPNTTYNYRAYVVVDGEYRYGEVSSFKTLKEEVTVSTGSAAKVTDNGATLSGTINNSDKSLTCGIIYGTSSSLSSSSGTKKSTTSLGTFSVSLTGLSSNTTYYYRAYVIVDGEYKYGEVLSFKTIKEVTVTTGSVMNITDSGATLSGAINNSDKSLTCGIIYGTSSSLSSSSGTKKSTTSSGAFSVSLTGLSSNTTYYYRAYAIVDGEYKYGEVSSFKTSKEVTVSTGSATNVTDSGSTLSGTINNSDKSLTCGIIYGTSSSLSSSSGTKKSTTSSGTFSVSLSGLSSNTTYYYRAYVVVDGEYRYGEVCSFYTKKQLPENAVDLGLSVYWASCNVGADSPEEYGGYYAWGETEEKSNYSWSTYKWCNGSYDTMTKYCTSSSYGTVDNKATLDLRDDVAYVKWGGSWRMPTLDEIKELINDCSWSWTTQNGVNGYKVTGPNGNSIFLPAAGYRDDGDVYDRGSYGVYWSSTLLSSYSSNVYSLYFDSGYHGWNDYSRFFGHAVRPVTD